MHVTLELKNDFERIENIVRLGENAGKGRIENTVRLGENAGNKHFLLVLQFFQVFYFRSSKWCFIRLSTLFLSYHGNSPLFMCFLGFISTRLLLWSVLPKDTPKKYKEDPVGSNDWPPGYESINQSYFHPFPKQLILDSSTLKRVCRQLRVGWSYEQFFLFPQCFKRLVLQTRKNQGLFGKGLIIDIDFQFMFSNPSLSSSPNNPWFSQPWNRSFWKHSRTCICWYPAFSAFPTMFSTLFKWNFNFSVTFILTSANAFNLDQFKYCCLVIPVQIPLLSHWYWQVLKTPVRKKDQLLLTNAFFLTIFFPQI